MPRTLQIPLLKGRLDQQKEKQQPKKWKPVHIYSTTLTNGFD
jgi:hypothetical protein